MKKSEEKIRRETIEEIEKELNKLTEWAMHGNDLGYKVSEVLEMINRLKNSKIR